MTIKNCPDCGGTHIGSYSCPLPPVEVENNKKKAKEGFWAKWRNLLRSKK